MSLVVRFLKNESGATAVEYGLIASLVCVAILAALNNFGEATESLYNYIETAIINAG